MSQSTLSFSHSDECLYVYFLLTVDVNWGEWSLWSVSLCLCHLITLMSVYFLLTVDGN